MSELSFENYLRDRLADHSEPVDPGGWELLLADLTQRVKRRTLYRRLYYGCAAAAAVILLFFILTPPDTPTNNALPPIKISVVTPQIHHQLQTAQTIQPILERRHKRPEPPTWAASEETIKQETEVIPVQIAQNFEIENPSSDSTVRQTPTNRPERPMTDWSPHLSHDYYDDLSLPKRKLNADEGWSIALTSSCANAVGETPFYPVLKQYSDNTRLSGTAMVSITGSSIDSRNPVEESFLQYTPPVSVGVNFQKELYPWISIGFGLNYTLLLSKFSNTYLHQTYTTRQYLHYVGIPVSALFNVMNQSHLRLYTSVGGAVEKAVSAYYISSFGAKQNTERVQASGLQWSVNAGLGTEYMLSKTFGIYLEPSAGYYFDNDQPRSIRTAQPVQFKIELGLRARI